jgi:para-nitrobenzyl esterase
VTINKKVNQYNNFPQRDGKLIPENPYIAYEQGKTKDIDIMIGTNANEMNYWVGELGGIVAYRFSMPIKFENDINALSPENKAKAQKFISGLKGHSIWRISEFYNELLFRLPAVKQAEEHRKNGGRTYMYYWTEPSTMKFRKACHAVELAYVFNNLDETIYTGDRGDEKLARIVQNMWTNFARTGDPSTEEIKWKEYDSLDRETMVLEKDVHMEKDVLKKQRELLFDLLFEFVTMSTSSIHYNVPFVRKAIFKILIILLIIVAAIVLGGLFM